MRGCQISSIWTIFKVMNQLNSYEYKTRKTNIWNLNLCNYKIHKMEVCFWFMVQNTSGSQLFGLYLNYHEGEKLDQSYFVEIFYRLIWCCFVKVFGKFQQFSKNPETGPTRELYFQNKYTFNNQKIRVGFEPYFGVFHKLP